MHSSGYGLTDKGRVHGPRRRRRTVALARLEAGRLEFLLAVDQTSLVVNRPTQEALECGER